MIHSPSEIETARNKGEFAAAYGTWEWISDLSRLPDPQRITECLPSSKGWSVHVSRSRVTAVEDEADFERFSGTIGSPATLLPPRRQAESTRELIQTIQQEADVRRMREVAHLHKKIEALTRRIASLERKRAPIDLGKTISVHKVEIPTRLTSVISAIEDSWSLVELGDDWDDNGALGFTEQTWRRTAEFLVRFAVVLASEHNVLPRDVEILPGSNGGLDIDLRLENRELLITVPANPGTEARFYGDDGHGNDQIKASLDTSRVPEWLSMWMAE